MNLFPKIFRLVTVQLLQQFNQPINQPSVINPSTNQPSAINPSTNQPSAINPSTNQPSAINPSTNQPSAIDPALVPQLLDSWLFLQSHSSSGRPWSYLPCPLWRRIFWSCPLSGWPFFRGPRIGPRRARPKPPVVPRWLFRSNFHWFVWLLPANIWKIKHFQIDFKI